MRTSISWYSSSSVEGLGSGTDGHSAAGTCLGAHTELVGQTMV